MDDANSGVVFVSYMAYAKYKILYGRIHTKSQKAIDHGTTYTIC